MTTNETIKCLMTRRSVRSFDPERIPSDELIKEVVTAGEYAPTGRGMQSPRIVVITNKAVRDRLLRMGAEPQFRGPADFRQFIEAEAAKWRPLALMARAQR